MTVRWAGDAFEDLSQADREAMLSWLRQAWEKLAADATQSGNATAANMVQGWWRDATGLTDASRNADVLANVDHYENAYAYGLTHPTSTGRIHAAPCTTCALPFVVVSGQALDRGPPATGGMFGSRSGHDLWNALATEAVNVYPGGDSLRGAIDQWRQEFEDDASGLGIARSTQSGVRSGRLLRMAQQRVAADRATQARVNPTPATPTPRGDVTQAQSSGDGIEGVIKIVAGLWILSKLLGK